MAGSIFFQPISLSFTLIFILSNTPQSLSQSLSPQNIQTFYPFSPPPQIPSPPPPPPPPQAFDRPPTTVTPPRRSSTRSAVGKAIGLTAAGTVILSGLLYLFLLMWSRRRERRSERNVVAVAPRGGANHTDDSFTRFNGNIKGLIVDENGLDVLYWRNLQEEEGEGEGKSGFKKQHYIYDLRDDRKEHEQEKRMVSGGERKHNNNNNKPPLQEKPLLRGKSSTSQSPIWAESDHEEDRIVKNASIRLTKVDIPNLGAPPTQIEVKTTADPPAPPPMPSNNGRTPPLPPQIAVVAAAKTAAPPRAPWPPSGGGRPPPIKPPMPSNRSSSLGEGTSRDVNGQVKLKPLHWDKVKPNAVDHSMVWDKIDKGSFKFDGDLMEALFGYVATNRKSPRGDEPSSTSPKKPDKSGPPSQIFILETRKSQNIAIVLKSLGVARKEIIDGLINGQGLDPDVIEKLAKLAPSDEETTQIMAFDGDPTRLADAESFLYHILKPVPSAFTRFNAMHFRSNYDPEVSCVKESFKSLELACNELRTRGLFFKLLEAVLKAGNRLNVGTSRGNAQGFNLTALRKLSDVKSSDGKTTLLQFVVQEVVRAEGKRCVLNKSRSLSRTSSQTSNLVESQGFEKSKDDTEREYMMFGLPMIGGLSSEFSNVKKAAGLDVDHLGEKITALSALADETRRSVSKCEDGGKFAREMSDFLDAAESEIKALRQEEIRVMDLVKRTRDYYSMRDVGANSEVFVIVRDFLVMVDKVCVDITRDVQRRKLPVSYVAVGSSSPEAPRVFRFPKLPRNFLSENSKSGTSESDGDSEAR